MMYKRVDDNLLLCKLSAEEVEDLNLAEILALMHEIGPNPDISQILGQIAYEPIMKTGFTKDVVIEVRDEDDEHIEKDGEVILYVWDRLWFEKQIEDEERESFPYLEGTGPANTDEDIYPYIDLVYKDIFKAMETILAIERNEWGDKGAFTVNFIKDNNKYHILLYTPYVNVKAALILRISEEDTEYFFCDDVGISKLYEHGERIM